MIVKVLVLMVTIVAPFMVLFLHRRRQESIYTNVPHGDRYVAASPLWILGWRGIVCSTVVMCLCLGLVYLAIYLWKNDAGFLSFMIGYVTCWYGLTFVVPVLELTGHRDDYIAFKGSTLEYRYGKKTWKVDLATTSIGKSRSRFVFRADNRIVFTINKLSMVGFQGSGDLWKRLEQLRDKGNL